MRYLLGRAIAVYYFVRTCGRIRGSSFLMSRSSMIRVARGARVRIGEGTTIGPQARIVARVDLDIGADVFIGKNSTIVAFSAVRIEDGVLIGENCSIHSENHGAAGRRQQFRSSPIRIARDAWLGAGVVVLPGVNIGEGATVGANAVVTRDVPSRSVAVGVPARVVRQDEYDA